MRRSLVVLLVLASLSVALSACDWAQIGWNSTQTNDNASESAITPANVSSLSEHFTATGPINETNLSEPVVAVGRIYVNAQNDSFYAFSASGASGCSGSPSSCSPLWGASIGASGPVAVLAVADGLVYGVGGVGNSWGVYAFDASGQSNCSGTPVVCNPLWEAALPQGAVGGVSVANGKIYALAEPAASTMEVFDASGSSNCSGTPKVCSPLWTAPFSGPLPGALSVSGNVAYATAGSTVFAFDANGSTGCSGSPKVCAPLWQYTATSSISGPAVISGQTLYVDTTNIVWIKPNPPVITGALEAFDANGVSGCSGTPKTCTPLWQSGDTYPGVQSPTIANGIAFVPLFGGGNVVAFDANGSSNCSGSPRICSPLWTTSATTSGSSPVVVGGSVLYVADGSQIDAYDANGVSGCSAAVCSPLWTASPGGVSAVSIANGTVYAAGFTSGSNSNAAVFAYGLP